MKSLLQRSSLLLIAGLLFAPAMAPAQSPMAPSAPASAVRQAPPGLLKGFDLASGTLQDLALPESGWKSFETTVFLAGKFRKLVLTPFDMRTRGFKLLIQDAKGLHEKPAPTPVTYRGGVRGDAGSRVAASLIGGQLKATIHLSDGSLWGIQPANEVRATLPASRHIVYDSGQNLALPFICGNTEKTDIGHPGGVLGPMMLATKVCEIGIDADYPFYQLNGYSSTNTVNDVTTVMNSVDAIYKRDVGIQYKITQIVVRTTTDPYSSTYPSTLLSQFRSYWNFNHGSIKRDVAHLFTGRNLYSSVIGVAYLSVVCKISSAYALSQSRFTSNLTYRVGLTAHEIGHNWSALHCSGSSCYIMCGGLGGCGRNVTLFGSVSKSKIIGFKNTRTCLSDPGPPLLTGISPSSVTAFRGKTVTLTGAKLSGATQVNVGTQTLTAFKVISDTMLTFDPPNATALGQVPVSVSNTGGKSNSLTLTFTVTKPPALDVPTVWVTGYNLEYAFGGEPNALWFLLISADNKTIPIFGYNILLNHFLLTSGTLNPAGIGSFKLMIPPVLKNYRIWSQIGTFAKSNPNPIAATNIISTFFY